MLVGMNRGLNAERNSEYLEVHAGTTNKRALNLFTRRLIRRSSESMGLGIESGLRRHRQCA